MTMDNEQIIDEASEWFVTLRDRNADPGAQDRFMDWLRRSPEHVEAYLGIVALWSDVSAIGTAPDTEAATLIGRARADNNVFPMASPPRAMHSSRVTSKRHRGFRFGIAAASALLVAGLGTLAYWNHWRGTSYETEVGEQRTLRLSDGSRVELNSRSRIVVRLSDTERVIELLSGQALFQVAKDPHRPFLVHSDAIRVRALGTQFDVNRRRDGTVITVVEGRVAVADHAREPAQDDALLSAGQQVTVRSRATRAPPGALAPMAADVAAVTAWAHGALVFRSEPLSSVVDEFNRYNSRRIVLEDSVDDFPITATFDSTDSQALVKFLAAQPDLRVETGGSDIHIRTNDTLPQQK